MARLFRWRSAALLLAVLAPLLGCLLTPGRWPLAALLLGVGLFWRWQGGAATTEARQTAVFAAYVVTLVLAGYLGVAGLWLLPGMAAGLVVWDVGLLLGRLTAVGVIGNEAHLINLHGRWLLLVTGLSLGLGGAALLIQISLSYAVTFVLAMVVFVGLGWVLRGMLEY